MALRLTPNGPNSPIVHIRWGILAWHQATLNLCSLNFIINYIRIINELKYENEVQIQAAQ